MSDDKPQVELFHQLDGSLGGVINLLCDLMAAVDRGDKLVTIGNVTVPAAQALMELEAEVGKRFPQLDMDEIRADVRRTRAS